MQTTVGQLLINSALPPHLRDYGRVLDKKGVNDLLEAVASERDPELYKTVVQTLHDIGSSAAETSGSSFSIKDFVTPPKTKRLMDGLRSTINSIAEDRALSPEHRERKITSASLAAMPGIKSTLMAELKAAKNPLLLQVISGSRGNEDDLRSLLAGDLLVTDHKDRVIAMPLTHGYASGVDPAEFWAGAYGARKGTIKSKLTTASTGFFGKQLIQVAHRQVVTENDCGTDRGIPVSSDDSDNVGTVLAKPYGALAAGTVVDSKVFSALKRGKNPIVYVRSPLTCEAKNGVCGRCAGIREHGDFPSIGDNVGVAAAQALAERVSQATLSEKHKGGRAGEQHATNIPRGFTQIDQLVQVPKNFRGAAAVASVDGVIHGVRANPAGGVVITVGATEHFVPPGLKATVKSGDRVEAGDVLSEGLPNPGDLVKYKGLGAGRLAFVDLFRKAYLDSKLTANRRNIELIARGLINHVRVTEMDGIDNALPDDVVEYSEVERNYRPRYGFKVVGPSAAVGAYLEKPELEYTIGTRITPKLAKTMTHAGVKALTVHSDPPPFEPEMLRAMGQLTVTPDWQVRLGGSYLQRGILEALHRGRSSKLRGESYIPSLARGKGFGDTLATEGTY